MKAESRRQKAEGRRLSGWREGQETEVRQDPAISHFGFAILDESEGPSNPICFQQYSRFKQLSTLFSSTFQLHPSVLQSGPSFS